MNPITSNSSDGIYIRNLTDVKAIIRHAKLDERNLTQVTQAIYYPSDDVRCNNLKLLELDEHILGQINEGKELFFKGGLKEKAVLCTDERTYDIKLAEVSNSLLLVPDLKFAASTSSSPLKSPQTNTSVDYDLNYGIDDDDDVPMERSVEHRKLLNIFHEYFECREIRPRYRKMIDILKLTHFSGPENEEFINRKFLFTFDQLLKTVQCSRQEFLKGLKLYRAIEYQGFIRVMECEYEYSTINFMTSLIRENSWSLNEIEKEETINALEGIVPKQIVENLFEIYTIPTIGKESLYTYNEELVARIVAMNILREGKKFRMDEFFETWQNSLPEGMKVEKKYLCGLGIFDKDDSDFCIKSLNETTMTTNMHDRICLLFKTKTKWTLDEIEPYIECFTTPTMSASMLMTKYTRCIMENDLRYYVAKH